MKAPFRFTPLLALFLFVPLWAASTASGAVVSRPVEYSHGGTACKGVLFLDEAVKGKRPAVMVVHEFWGLNDYVKKRCAMLAELGYVAFAADMYGDGMVTTHAPEASGWSKQIQANIQNWRERALKALDILKGQPEVDPARVAAMGYCFGGSTVMQMAYAGADLRGVASFHGALPPAEGVAKGSIKAKVLACHGADDAMIPLERVAAFQKSLDEAGAVWEFITFSGTRHSFTNPDADKAGMANAAYNKRADMRSWEALLGFLKEVFSQ
ncbi:dienelactone hydrolase family protein [Fundidesulfovibrio soli]|uniref:dienelactone hydrolase family protein n=1 Tax=Fundidesulfovibrio soli TaxID=2922716 RepID=UPI001FB03BFC|nr:dienelactone hydrolase family protein [Fundidesulfovibrio soli]